MHQDDQLSRFDQNSVAGFGQQPALHLGHHPSQQQQLQGRRKQSKQLHELAGINLDNLKLERSEVTAIVAHFKRYERPIISFLDLLNIAKKFSYDVNPKMKEFILKEIEARNIKKVDLDAVLVIIGQVKMYYQRIEEENQTNAFNEYVDVFVALGGNADQSGNVAKSTILEIIKTEFELTYDMEVFLEKIETRGEMLDFPAFCLLFEGSDDHRQLAKSNSVLSLLSNRSKRSVKSNQSLKVRFRDFEKFYAQMEAQEKHRQQQNLFDNQANLNESMNPQETE